MAETKPAPFPRGEEQRWFAAAREGRLIYQHCVHCGTLPSYPRALCPNCWSQSLQEEESAGTGVLHSFTIQHRAGAPGFATDVPYVPVLVDLDEGARVLAELRDHETEDLRVGLPVEVFFDTEAELPLPRFRPRKPRCTA